METPAGKYAWIVKIGQRGQFVIPKKAREMFDLRPGSEILVPGDAEKGLAIMTRAQQEEFLSQVFSQMDPPAKEG